MRFSYEWVDVEKEKFTADVSEVGTTTIMNVLSVPQFVQTPIYKIEEVAVKMPMHAAVGLAAALVSQLSQMEAPHQLNEQQRKQILDAYALLQGT